MARQGWHPEDIKAAIRKTGITLTQLSLKNGLGESTVRQAILFNSCPTGERVIFKYLKINPYELWPQRYNKNGQRIIGHAAKKSTKNKGPRHGQKGEAA